jgi:hypothetical protein
VVPRGEGFVYLALWIYDTLAGFALIMFYEVGRLIDGMVGSLVG